MTGRRDGRPVNVPQSGLAAPLTISAICRTDAVVDALSERRFAVAPGPRTAGPADGDDPAVRLLQSLIVDVDQGAPEVSAERSPEPSAAPAPAPAPQGRPRRRGARTFMALGISTAVLGTTGVAAASGELGKTFERSIGVHQPSAQPHAGSRAQVRGTGRSVVEGPVGPMVPAPTASGTWRPGTDGASRGAAGDQETDRPRPRPGAAPDRDQDQEREQDTVRDAPTLDEPTRDQEPGRTPRAVTPTGPDGPVTPRKDEQGGQDGQDEPGATDPCPAERRSAKTRGPMGSPGPC
ncbi:hypothetical protein [Actinomadura sp. HBU206391]|uniref:hypothetical protein n=1 Tax=Actinomadura sp. HBU206391 TaxID=2731692 RepID=UPI00164F1925|nr:hypothetical protein [Actinomadura sp. HBU206391]MBC6456980.1 hypothetical protein [Actinomadura sp. HBU206391]